MFLYPCAFGLKAGSSPTRYSRKRGTWTQAEDEDSQAMSPSLTHMRSFADFSLSWKTISSIKLRFWIEEASTLKRETSLPERTRGEIVACISDEAPRSFSTNTLQASCSAGGAVDLPIPITRHP